MIFLRIFCLSLLTVSLGWSAMTVSAQDILKTDDSRLMNVSIAPFLGDCKAAISYTFDDGLLDQYSLARPELNKRGMRATFAIIGSKVGGKMRSKQDRIDGTDGTPCMTWEMLRQLAAEGHEVSSHGWSHRNVTRLNGEELRYEVQHNDTMIFEQTGYFPRTYFYPGNKKSEETVAFCEQDRVGSRTFQISLGSKRDSSWMHQWVKSLLEKRAWGVAMIHGIATGYDHFADPQLLWQHWDEVSAMRDSLWVAPFCEVSAYVKERENVQLSVKERKNRVVVTPQLSLDSKIFIQPLTLRITGYRITEARQDDKPLVVYEKNGIQQVNFMPSGGKIVLKTTSSSHALNKNTR